MKNIKFNIIQRTGFEAACLMGETKELCDNCNQMYSLFIIANKNRVWTNRIEVKEHKEKTFNYMKEKIVDMNKTITSYNKDMKQINPELKLNIISYSDINKELSKFYNTKETDYDSLDKLIPYLIGSFNLYVFNKVKPLLDQLSYNKDIMDLHIKSFGLDKVNQAYHKSLYEVIDLYFMGYRSTSLLVLGRLFEGIVTRYLIKLCKDGKINFSREAILNMRFENKLNLLKAKNFISEKDWLIIAKLKFDRNISGHFVDRILVKEAEIESEATIKLALKIINKFDKKIKK